MMLTLPQLQVDTEELLRLRTKLLPPYKVILFNDDYNEMNYVVAALLHAVNSLTQPEAEHIMLTAHLTGSARPSGSEQYAVRPDPERFPDQEDSIRDEVYILISRMRTRR